MKKVIVKLLISISTAVVIISGTALLVISFKFHHEQTKGTKNETIKGGVLTVLKQYHQDFHCSEWGSLLHGKHGCGQNKPKFDNWENLPESICLKYSLASTYTALSLVGICLPVIIQLLVSLWAALPIFDRHFRDQECILSIWISRGLEGFLHLMGIHILVALMLFKYHREELDWRDEMKRELDDVVDVNCKEKETTLNFLVLCQRINIIVVLVQLVTLLITGLWAEQDGPDCKVSHQKESEGVIGEFGDQPHKSELTQVEMFSSSQNDIKKEEISAAMTVNFNGNGNGHDVSEELELDDEAENNLRGTSAPDENSVAEVQGPRVSAVPSGGGVQDDDSGGSSSSLKANKNAIGLAVIHDQLAHSIAKPSRRETSSKSNAMRSNINSSKISTKKGNKSVQNRKGNSRNAPGMTGFS